jgi:hypothetical protein
MIPENLIYTSQAFLFEKWYPGDPENPAEEFSKKPRPSDRGISKGEGNGQRM